MLPAVTVLSLVLHHRVFFFPHKIINAIVGVKIMQEFHLLFSSLLIILMVAKKKKKLYSTKYWNLERKSHA